MTRAPEVIYVIRHGEKPADLPLPAPGQPPPAPAPPFGVEVDGKENIHSLLPRGWQRSGALVALFDPATGPLQARLRRPEALFSPSYGHTTKHRTRETIEGLSERLGVPIDNPFPVGEEAELAASVVSVHSKVVLICWEHDHIPAIASALPTVPGTVVPAVWPDGRFDVVWCFSVVSGAGAVRYTFAQIPQQLLSGDSDTVIPG